MNSRTTDEHLHSPRHYRDYDLIILADLSRYARQIIFPDLGQAGQRRLLDSTVVLIGCGATGTVIANHLARSGVGRLRIVNRDFID